MDKVKIINNTKWYLSAESCDAGNMANEERNMQGTQRTKA